MHIFKTCGKDLTKGASLTIELSMLMPGIITVLIIIIFCGYYFHDKCVIQRAAYSAALKTSYESGTEADYARDLFEENVSKCLLGKWNIEDDVTISDDEIRINVQGTMSCFSGFVSGYVSDRIFSINVCESVNILNEPAYIRDN